ECECDGGRTTEDGGLSDIPSSVVRRDIPMTISRDAVIEWLKAFAEMIAQNKDYLTQLDADIGDGDHGANMNRGMQTVLTALPGVADKDIGSIFKTVGMKLVSTVG